jgi:hypothetical protein
MGPRHRGVLKSKTAAADVSIRGGGLLNQLPDSYSASVSSPVSSERPPTYWMRASSS